MEFNHLRSRSISDVHADATVVSSTAATTLATFVVPPLLTAGDILAATFQGDLLSNNGAQTYTFTVALGATTLFTSSIGPSASATRRGWLFEMEMLLAATNDERAKGHLYVSSGSFSTMMSAGTAAVFGRGTAAEDLTAGKNLTFTVTLSSASASQDCVLHDAWLTIAKRSTM